MYIALNYINTYRFIIVLVVAALLSAIAGAITYYWFIKFRLKLKLSKRFKKAFDGEKSAHTLLEKNGYLLDQTQKVSSLKMYVNNQSFSYKVRPDGFATKEGKSFLVEVKTGKVATNPTLIATRRQLLEYFHGFDVDGVLLVDAEEDQIHKIHFDQKIVREESEPIIIKPSKSKWMLAFILGFILALFMVGLCL